MAISPLAEALPLSKPVPTRLRRAVSSFTFLLLAISSVIGLASAFAQDRQPSTTHFDVEELVDTVLRQNAGIQALQASVFAAEARVTPAGSLSDPRLSAAVAPETLDGLDTPAGRTRGPNVRVEISQEIPWPGTLGLRADAAPN